VREGRPRQPHVVLVDQARPRGLRYLQYYEFRLVRGSLVEREVLLHAAPHAISPLTFVLPRTPEQRPAWLMRLGLLLYDNLGGRELLPGSAGMNLAEAPEGAPLKPEFCKGFTYSDAWVDDSRLVTLNAMDAAERGVEILTRTRCVGARRDGGWWRATLEGSKGRQRERRARALVNATGPWVSTFLRGELALDSRKRVRLVKGSHIVVRRLFEHDRAYILQNINKRVVLAIPYLGRFTLIGTTDVAHGWGPWRGGHLAGGDRVPLWGRQPLLPAADLARRGGLVVLGVRPLYDDARGDPSAVTRDYMFDLDAADRKAPLLSVFGGKLTTYRKLAEHALAKLQPVMGFEKGAWTAKAHVPGATSRTPTSRAFSRPSRRATPRSRRRSPAGWLAPTARGRSGC
jgi:glycerol-3-phosphate dehydrogenase